MKKFMTFMALLLLVSGCADKKVVHEPIKNEILAYTSKAEVINGDERALIIATYVNPISKAKNSENLDKFILSISPESAVIDASSISINNKKDVNITEIISEDERLKQIGFNLPWARHYEITAPSQDADILKLSFGFFTCETCPSNAVVLEFQKVAKSLYWNP